MATGASVRAKRHLGLDSDFSQFAQTCCQSVQSHIDPMRMHGSSHEEHCVRFDLETLTPDRAMSYITRHSRTPSGDPRPQLSGVSAEHRP